MGEQSKKISFGFSKLSKKTNVLTKPVQKKENIQLIDCLESQTIKLKDAVVEHKGPLIIPMPDCSDNILERRRDKLRREIKNDNIIDDKPESELTPDELAARELIREAQQDNIQKNSSKVYSLSVAVDNSFIIEGKEESTLEDYESVPVNDYGKAMLRGMGWKEGIAIGKTSKQALVTKEPILRPKGMGLGANKLANTEQPKPVDKDGKDLILKKGAYAKIIEGKQKGNYCEVQGFDDEGRVIVKTSLQGSIISINEVFIHPVTKEEYAKCSKVINNAKYEEYKNKIGESSKSHQNSNKVQEKSDNNTKSHRHKDKHTDKQRTRHRSSSGTNSDKDVSKSDFKRHKSSRRNEKSRDRRDYRYHSSSDSDTYKHDKKRRRKEYHRKDK